jgi:hypothetical protein
VFEKQKTYIGLFKAFHLQLLTSTKTIFKDFNIAISSILVAVFGVGVPVNWILVLHYNFVLCFLWIL